MSGPITLKITSLLIRTISKPVANAIKARTRQSPLFKRNFIRFGQFINRLDLKLRNNSNIKVRPLNDNKAIELGSNFLSELFVFSIGAGLILYELFKPKKQETCIPVEVSEDGNENKSTSTHSTANKLNSTENKVTIQPIQELKITKEIKEQLKNDISESLHLNDLSTTVNQLTIELKDLKNQNSAILEELNKLKSIKP